MIALFPRRLHLPMTYVFRFHMTQIDISNNPGHIVIHRHGNGAHALGNETGQAFGGMVFSIPLLSHFGGIFSSTRITGISLSIAWSSFSLRSFISRWRVPLPMMRARGVKEERSFAISFHSFCRNHFFTTRLPSSSTTAQPVLSLPGSTESIMDFHPSCPPVRQ